MIRGPDDFHDATRDSIRNAREMRAFDRFWSKARAMWKDGSDTKDIAFALNVHESVIYNDIEKVKA